MHTCGPGAMGGIRLRRTLSGLALLLALTLGGAAADETCWTTSEPMATVPDVDGSLGGDIYVYAMPETSSLYFCGMQGICPIDWWIYQETNGIAGWQRDDFVSSDVAHCTDGTQGDTIIY